MDKYPSIKNHILPIKGVGPKTAEKLVKAGYTDIVAISESTPQQLKDQTGIPMKIASKVILGAKSFYSTHGMWMKKIRIPREYLLLDIEVCIEENKLWMIGVKRGEEIDQLVSSRLNERVVLQAFYDYLKENPTPKVILCYSANGYDFREIMKRSRYHGLFNIVLELQRRELIDLGKLLMKYFYPPGGSLKLKDLAQQFGYRLELPDLDGRKLSSIIAQDFSNQGFVTRKSIQMASHYNADDCRIIEFLLKRFSNNITLSTT